MTASIFREYAPQYWDRHLSVVPVKPRTKQPSVQRWTDFAHNLPNQERRSKWLADYGNHGIALLLGVEVASGYSLAAIDVDDDRLVRMTRAFLGNPITGKVGKKGVTFFVVVPNDEAVKSTTLRSFGELGNVDFLFKGRCTLIPPTIHPDTSESYQWVGREILSVQFNELPSVGQRELRVLKEAVASEHVPALILGRATHDPGLAFVAQLLSAGATDDEIHAIVHGLLPESYSGDTLQELQGWIDDGRKKGFAPVGELSLPLDEAIARAVAQELDPVIYSEGDGFMRYTDGHWRRLSDADVDRAAKALLLKHRVRSSVSAYLRPVRTCLSLNVERTEFGIRSNRICLKNGTLNLATAQLEPHSPEHELRYQLDIDWDPEAECPVYDRHVRETLIGDEKAIALFDEFAALTLVPEMKYQKALFLIGPGGSGKSTLLRVVQTLHDPDAVSVTPLDKIDDERHRTELARKLVNISFDVQTEKKVFGETFIRITGGDAITTRRLYQEVNGHVQPTVRFLGSMNPELPEFIASPDALQRRLIFVPCGARVENPDPDRFNKLQVERAGILARFVRAFRRLEERGGFDIPEQVHLEVEEYVSEQDPFDIWVSENLHDDPNERVAVAEITREYNYWADQVQARRLGTQQVGKKLNRLGFRRVFGRREEEGRSVNTRMVFARLGKNPGKTGAF